MGMKNYLWGGICLFCLALVMCFSLIYFNYSRKISGLKKSFKKQQNISKTKDKYFSMTINTCLLDFGKNLESVRLFDEFGKEHKIKDVNKNDFMLLFVVSDEHCSLCIEAVLPELQKIDKLLLKKNIVIAGNFQNFRNMKLFKKDNNLLGIRVYALKNKINLKVDERNVPYFILIDKDSRLINTFIPEKSLLRYTNNYLKALENIFE